MNGMRFTGFIPVLMAMFMVSGAFVCAGADGSDADIADFQTAAYVKVSGTYDKIADIWGGEGFFTDEDAIELVFISDVYEDSCDTKTSADKVFLEKTICEGLAGGTYTETTAEKVTVKNAVIDRVMTSSVAQFINTGIDSDGLGPLSQYIRNIELSEDVEIKCTVSDCTIQQMTTLEYTYVKCGPGFLLSGLSEVLIQDYRGDFVYTIVSGENTRTFTVSLDYSVSMEDSGNFVYSSDKPVAGEDLVMKENGDFSASVRQNSLLSFDGRTYSIRDPRSGEDHYRCMSHSVTGIWHDYDEDLFLEQLPSGGKIGYSALLGGLDGSDEESVSLIGSMGGTLNRDVSDAEKFAESIASTVNNGSGGLNAGIAAATLIAIAVIALALWKGFGRDRRNV